MAKIMGWNEQVIQLLKDIRTNGTPEADSTGAVNLRLNDIPVSVSNPLPIGDGGGALTIDGTVNVGNFPATQTVGGTVAVNNFPTTQPVSGLVAVSNLPGTQHVDGTVNVGNFPATQPVSGTVAASNLPATKATLYSDLGTAAMGVAKGSAGDVFALCGHNLATVGTRYLQLFNKATAPSTGEAPVLYFPVFSGNSWTIGNQFFGLLGVRFTNGIAWAWSTTAKTYSAVGAPSEHSTFITLL